MILPISLNNAQISGSGVQEVIVIEGKEEILLESSSIEITLTPNQSEILIEASTV